MNVKVTLKHMHRLRFKYMQGAKNTSDKLQRKHILIK